MECNSCFDVDGNETSNSIVMADREAVGGHYEERTTLIGTPFLVCNGARHGVYGDPLLASDGKDCCYVDALHESSYPAVRVEPSGVIAWSEVEGGRKYWGVYGAASPQLSKEAVISTSFAACWARLKKAIASLFSTWPRKWPIASFAICLCLNLFAGSRGHFFGSLFLFSLYFGVHRFALQVPANLEIGDSG